MFNSERFDFKILSVLHLNFPASERNSPSRPYNVLVFRTRGDAEVFDDLFQKLLTCWNNKPLGFEYRIDALFLSILENLEKQSIEENADSIFINVQLAIDQMHASFSDPDFSIRALAERLGYCNSYFRRIFKSVTQKSPRDYLVELRIEHAVNLLQSGYYNVEQVSERCGFNSAKYFSTAFKAVTGRSPSKMLP